MESNKSKVIIFLIILIIFIAGGFILMQKSFNNNGSSNNTITNEIKEIRIDKAKDYIYFTDRDVISEELDIEYSKVNFNFKGQETLEKEINEEINNYKKTIKHDDSLEDEAYDKLSYAKYSKNEVYNYERYLSLLINVYEFETGPIVRFDSAKAYVFNINDGKIIGNKELLKLFDVTDDDIEKKVKEFVEGQNLLNTEEEIDLNSTLKSIKNPALFVDKLGRLCVSILVKSNQNDYNEVIILN